MYIVQGFINMVYVKGVKNLLWMTSTLTKNQVSSDCHLTYVNVSVVRFVLLQFGHGDFFDHILLDILAKPEELIVEKVFVFSKFFCLFLCNTKSWKKQSLKLYCNVNKGMK